MRSELQQKCDCFIESKESLKKVLAWREDVRIQSICASLYAQEGKIANPDQVERCVKTLKKETGIFSDVRGMALTIIACMIDICGGSENCFEKFFTAHDMLKKSFKSAQQLPLAAEILAEKCETSAYDSVITRAKGLYDRMRKQHPFLTGADDYVMCVVLAFSDKTDDELLSGAEEVYCYLKNKLKWVDSNALQAVGHTVAQYDGDKKINADKILNMLALIKENHRSYDKTMGIPILGVLTQCGVDEKILVEEIVEVSDWLKPHKGFGPFGMGEGVRMVYAAMLVLESYSRDVTSQSNLASSVISAIIAEQIAMIACMSAVMASTTTSI